jgi:hypothetical protein
MQATVWERLAEKVEQTPAAQSHDLRTCARAKFAWPNVTQL